MQNMSDYYIYIQIPFILGFKDVNEKEDYYMQIKYNNLDYKSDIINIKNNFGVLKFNSICEYIEEVS